MATSMICNGCHGAIDPRVEPYLEFTWEGNTSMFTLSDDRDISQLQFHGLPCVKTWGRK